MAVKRTGRFNLKYFFYWVLAVSFTVWSWTFLYLHSFNNVWGNHEFHNDISLKASNECYNEVATLEAFHAPSEELFPKRMRLAGYYDESREYEHARKALDLQLVNDKNEPESQELLERRLKIEEFKAHTYLEEGKFGEPRENFKHALDIAATIEKKYNATAGKLYKASLTNEIGIVDYLEGSCLLVTDQRKGLFDNSRKQFSQAIEQIDALNAPDVKADLKLDAKARQLSLTIKRHAQANLAQVEEDQRYEWMYEKT